MTCELHAVVVCPFPFTGDDGTVAQCIARGHCGCDELKRTWVERPAENEPDPHGDIDGDFSY